MSINSGLNPTRFISMAAAVSWLMISGFVLAFCLAPVVGMDSQETLAMGQYLRLGQSLTSANGRFELGFFNVSSGDTKQESQYLGIWYKGIKPLSVVWVGNREEPLRPIGVKLYLNPGGDLMVRDYRSITCLVKLNQSLARPLLVLEDSGNLAIRDGQTEFGQEYVWQSFDVPSDTLLPGMKLGWDLKRDRVLTSWRTSEDPRNGDFVFSINSSNSPQLLVEKNGVVQSRWGPWDGKSFSGTNFNDNQVFKIVYRYSPEEVYFMFQMIDNSVLMRLEITPNGAVQFLKWKDSSRAWLPMVTLNRDTCERHGSCGPYGVCHADDPGCQCLNGFVEKSPNDWRRLDYTDGCRRKKALNCSDGDGFRKFTGLKLPDNFTIWRGFSPSECRDSCQKDCTCMAYTSLDVYGNGSQCVVWLSMLIDMKDSANEGDELYIRMARAELESISGRKKRHITIIFCVIGSAICGAALWRATMKCRYAFYKACRRGVIAWLRNGDQSLTNQNNNHNVKVFDMAIISAATNRFSTENKIGEGGFGTVYLGELPDGQQIAVKKLSTNSNQGVDEFKNEVQTIAQLQHRNLVKLMGCSVAGAERMLIYEFLPNKSLDQIIFIPEKKQLLSWVKRIAIIKGVARGLEYLHFGSRLRIIHRDLKASNVLLDEEMNPKISDFGLARHCESAEEQNTRRVIGTYGYMSPEYMIEGYYSTKSDVFSFGVLAVEIISGHRNWGFQHPDHEYNLLGHAWKLWNEGKETELVDPAVKESMVEAEAARFIRIGLLCAQHSVDKRPAMPQVVAMLENENIGLPGPLEPGFFSHRSTAGNDAANSGWSQESINWLTVTSVSARE